jgi:hypothetical protein
MQEFLRWVQNSPEGPAWHAILESNSHGIVGHQCFIPLRGKWRGRRIVAAKSEYTFLREDFQATRIRGLEGIKRPTHIVAAHQLVQRCQTEGWGPFLISTTPSLRRRGFYGFISTDFPLWECLLVLRPIVAARETPSLVRWKRVCLLLGGAVQKTVWSSAALCVHHARNLRPALIDDGTLPSRNGLLSFFEDLDSLRWRYPDSDYRLRELDLERRNYIIQKRGSANQYMRVCQWLLDPTTLSISQIAGLIQMAQGDGALGVRWAIYGRDEAAKVLVQRLRRFGFLCVQRVRTLQIKSNEPEFLVPENWNLTDAMFSFHW